MGMDVWFEYNYIEEGKEVEYEFMDLRKPYWLNSIICNYLKDDVEDNEGCYKLDLNDLIGLRNFFQLCLDYPKLINIGGDGKPWNDTLVKAINEINTFISDFDTSNLKGQLYYIVSI